MKTKKNQKQVSIEEYIETYCQEKRIRERSAVYISPETHEKLKKAAWIFYSEHHTTTSSLADSIISCHFKEHRELLNDAYEEQTREVLEWLKDRGRSEEQEEQPDDVEV
ncbi:MAG: DUF3408 domain-containing protein [Dysgonamonadaceae bacterium]|jgi:hypothetical protein|nr:DUF3408 domain-containing protein [Dysgonamonadaceae bacterium]